MGFFGAIKSVLTKYANFSGRATRSEYWWWVLFTLLWAWIPIVNLLLLLIFFLPSLGVAVRRLHDTGRSGWWILLGIIPILGGLILLIFYCTDSQVGANQYGPNPKGVNLQTDPQPDPQPAAEPVQPAPQPVAEPVAEPAPEPIAEEPAKPKTEAERWEQE